MADQQSGSETRIDKPKKQILLNAFDMSTVGHLSPGQWKVGSIAELAYEKANAGDRTPKTARLKSEV